MSIEEIEPQNEAKSEEPKTSALSYLNLKWKRKHWFGLIIFNVAMTLLLVLDRIGYAKEWGNTTGLIVMSVGLPVFATFLAIYIWVAKKEYREFSQVIKPARVKYFERGVSASIISFILTLLALVVSYSEGWKGTITAPVVVYTFLSLCIILGITSCVFSSMYEFCACFDIFYHKNKETILREYLEREHKLKIIEETEEKEE